MKSNNGNFIFIDDKQVFSSIAYENRSGERRMGDALSFDFKAKFQLIGICESIGPMANNGLPGAENGFNSFLQQFSLTQIHDDFNGNSVSLLGCIQLTNENTSRKLNVFEGLVEELDAFVLDLLSRKLEKWHIPVVIGGGHNNSLPLIRWANQEKLNFAVVNVDPHADTRKMDFRHSGNSFAYALKEKIVSHYHVLGLHEAYNNEFIRSFLKQNAIFHTFFEDYLFKKRNISKDIGTIATSINDMPCGLELDLDAIAYFPSSAKSPSGWTLNQMRQILFELTTQVGKVSYLHLPEAAPTTIDEYRMCGKSISYLVRDFIANYRS
jgi:formiminoglutamase